MPIASARDQDALRVHAVQDVLEAAALLADAVLASARAGRRRTAGWSRRPCGPSCRSRGPRRSAAVERGVEQRQALGALLDLLDAAWCAPAAARARPPAPSRSRSSARARGSRCRARTARVLSLVVSRPASGSVTAKQAFSVAARSAAAGSGCFCSSVPNTTTGLRPKMFMCTRRGAGKAAPDSATACIMTAASVMPSPIRRRLPAWRCRASRPRPARGGTRAGSRRRDLCASQ